MPSHALEDQHRVYADAEKCSLRTAQRHSKSSHPRWVEFWFDRGKSSIQREKDASISPSTSKTSAPSTSGGQSPATFDLPTPPDAMRKPAAERTLEESILCAQFTIYSQLVQDFNGTSDPITRSGLARTIPEALKAFHAASKACQYAQTAARVLVPVAEFNECAEDLSHVSALLNTMDLDIADKANPENPALARSVIKNWLANKFNPWIESVASGFSSRGSHEPAQSAPATIDVTAQALPA